MKKLVLFVGAALLSTSMFAQKATLDNPWSLEGVINYDNASGIMWSAPKIRARYFVTDNIAARVQLGLGDGLGTPKSESYTFYENADGSGNTGTLEISRMSWNAQIGGEYHLAGTDRMSPYFMLGINFGGGKSTATTENSDGTVYMNTVNTEQTGKFSMFGVGVGAGMDFYVYENLYLGLEMGLSFSSYNYADREKTVSMGANPVVTTTTVTPGNKKSYIETGAMNAAFRLGWRF